MVRRAFLFFFMICTLFLSASITEAADHWIDGDDTFSWYVRDETVMWSNGGKDCEALIIKVNDSSGKKVNSMKNFYTYTDGEWYCANPMVKGFTRVDGNRFHTKALNYLLTLR